MPGTQFSSRAQPNPTALVLNLFGLFLFAHTSLCAADITLHGRVVDENEAPVRDARVTVHSAAVGNIWHAQTDPTGAFELTLPPPGNLTVTIEREGYYALRNHSVNLESTSDVIFVINTVREVFQSENVSAQASPVDVGETQNQEHLTGTEMTDIPFANSHNLRSSLEALPGVVLDGSGSLHVNGSSENQVLYLFNGFNISNPISGQFQTILPVEGIRSVDLSSGQFSPEYGKGSAGVLHVNTETGTDKFHYTATDFIPGIDINPYLRIGNWYPRVGASGPIIKGRAWFADTFISQYSQALVIGLPNGGNTRRGWAGSNVLHGQMNLTPSNILYADFLLNIDNENRVGLGPRNPVETTYSINTRQYFASIKDQEYFGRGALLEFGFGHNYFSTAQIPQGQNLYNLLPQGNSGNYFVHSTQAATRDQGMTHAFLPKVQFAGSHQSEAGAEVDALHYDADFRRTGYEVFGLSGEPLSKTLFPSPAKIAVTNTELSTYLLDTWRVSKNLQFGLGIRTDRDQSIHAAAWSPRLAFSWSPFASSGTRISGGYSITHDAITMQMLGTPRDQTPYTTILNIDGTPAGPPVPATFQIPHTGVALPRAVNWTLIADRQLSSRLFVTAKYLRRRGTDGFTFLNSLAPDTPPSLLPYPNPQTAAIYQLTNLRRDDYDSITASIRQTLSGQFEWMAAYTYSRSLSNVVIDPSSPFPLQLLSNLVQTPWDSLHRILSTAYLPLPWKNWAISGLADLRTGFPFSVRDQTGLIVGTVDGQRYPLNFDLNVALERIVTLHGYRYALRGGMDNLTNQANPTAVNNVIGSPQYLQFAGKQGRHFVVRIRFFGRAGKK